MYLIVVSYAETLDVSEIIGLCLFFCICTEYGNCKACKGDKKLSPIFISYIFVDYSLLFCWSPAPVPLYLLLALLNLYLMVSEAFLVSLTLYCIIENMSVSVE